MCLKAIVSKQHIKMFVFIKKLFYIGSLFLSLVSTTSLDCILMKIKSIKKQQKLLMLKVMNLHFILLVLKQVNVMAVVIILMINMQKYVFLML